MLRSFRATVEYDGTDYAGFQIQVDRPTVQGELEKALARLAQEPIRIKGAGRTDAGVHARGQVISFRSSWRHEVATLQRAMNAVLPKDIAIRALDQAEERFHARFSAESREYLYSVYEHATRIPVLDRFWAHAPKMLDDSAMAAAADLLIGEHDMATFGQPTVGDITIRRVIRAVWTRLDAPTQVGVSSQIGALQFCIEANGFLRGMVRRIVSTLMAVGHHELMVDEFGKLVESRDIGRASAPAPARGLVLNKVRYLDT